MRLTSDIPCCRLLKMTSLLAIEERLAARSQAHEVPFTLVALSAENDFLGTASIKRFELPAHPDKEHWLGEVFIPKGLRGQGIGSSMIAECIKRSLDLGVQALYLYTPDQQRLYERFGWQEAVQTVVNDEAVSIMVRHATHNLHVERDAPPTSRHHARQVER
ncbi:MULTISPECIES: GNAT family N-acetyltransferase [unclassified Thiomonas]|uniref:GNAT family N-acetyltransferase n=1 Tax=unclassified Thiomonas TaxID=2625466 RepID=UPI0012DF23C7|nr:MULTISPECIES: GNAT family N-acetyltransferase [unclassified Thiomonas]